MDVLWFLRERTHFIRRHYRTASLPFRERIRKIDAGEEPFEPPYSEDPDCSRTHCWCCCSGGGTPGDYSAARYGIRRRPNKNALAVDSIKNLFGTRSFVWFVASIKINRTLNEPPTSQCRMVANTFLRR
jgi:hypothetical protein